MKITIEIDTSLPADLESLLRLHDALDESSLPRVSRVAGAATRRGRKDPTAATLAAFAEMTAQDKAAAEPVHSDAEVTAIVAEVQADTVPSVAAETPEQPVADIGKPISPPEEQEAAAREEMALAAGAIEPPVADTRSHDELLAAAREKAADEGALFLRSVIQKYGVKGLSHLNDDQLREVLS